MGGPAGELPEITGAKVGQLVQFPVTPKILPSEGTGFEFKSRRVHFYPLYLEMLDFNHPQARWRFAASRENDAILTFTKLMTLLPSPLRQQLLPRISRHLERLRRINREHFAASEFIDHAISDLEIGYKHIANLQSNESRLDGHGVCPVCGSEITDLADYSDMTYCNTCLDHIQDPRQRLASFDGFGFDAI